MLWTSKVFAIFHTFSIYPLFAVTWWGGPAAHHAWHDGRECPFYAAHSTTHQPPDQTWETISTSGFFLPWHDLLTLSRPLTRVLAHSLVQVYPGERHSLRHPDSNEHYLTSLLSFLKKNLWDLITARWGSSTWTNKIATNLWVQCRVQPCEIYDRRKMQSSRSVSQREKWSICLHFNCWLAYNLLTNVQHYAVKPLQANKLL